MIVVEDDAWTVACRLLDQLGDGVGEYLDQCLWAAICDGDELGLKRWITIGEWIERLSTARKQAAH